jgi:hypothetical protein
MAGTKEAVDDYLARNISNIDMFSAICYSKSRAYGKPMDCLKLINSIHAKNSHEYEQVVRIISINQTYILEIMKKNRLDGLVLPSGRVGIASYDWKTIADQSVIASNSGLPEITLPVAQYNGLPVSLEILGHKNAESELLNYAFAYEQHYYSFKAPTLIADQQFKNWNIDRLNILYPLIGKISFETVIKPNNNNTITSNQSAATTKKAVAILDKQ